MVTVVYSTRESNEAHKKHIISSSGLKDKIEVIEIINNGEMSLTQAFNKGLKEAKYEYVVFCHDDIIIDTKQWGVKLIKQMQKNPEYGIIGVAGTTDLISGTWWDLKKSMCGVVTHTHNGKTWVSKYSSDQNDKIKEVVVLDGLFFVVNINKIKTNFNEKYNGFHFYDVTFCVDNYLQGVKIGLTTKIKITHKSIGITNDSWEENKKQFENEYLSKLPLKLTNNCSIEERLNFNKDSIGVGMVTYNAEHRIRLTAKTVPTWIKNFVIVNDGTPYDIEAYPTNALIIQHDENKSVGEAKNTAIEHLLAQGCEHIFLIEDDMIITDENVFEQYIKTSIISGIKHLNFGLHGPRNKTNSENGVKKGLPNPIKVMKYEDGIELAFYANCVGSFSYYHNSIFESVGLFNKEYKNAWEHIAHTLKIINNKFHTSFWYFADINESWKYIKEIPNSFEDSVIGNIETIKDNSVEGLTTFYKEFGFFPTDIPTPKMEFVDAQLKYLYLNR